MKKIFLLLTLSLNFFAIELDEIVPIMQKNIDKSLQFLQNIGDKREAADRIFELFDGIIDFELMAKLSLSQNYSQLSEHEQGQFNKAFKMNLKKSLTDKLSFYKDELLRIKKGKLINDRRYFLHSSMVIDGEEKSIIFKFYNNNDDWLIYDIDILGISIVQTYRSQFSDILANKNFNTLMQKLQNIIIE